jgi:chromate transporter
MSAPRPPNPKAENGRGRPGEVFRVFLKLGCTSFGGPVAHLGYFQNELVARRQWVDEETYAHLVSLCQFLPGPASSQVGLALGWKRAGSRGAMAAWLGFTLPSAALMTSLALGLRSAGGLEHAGWVQGLRLAAVAVVAQAVVLMYRRLCPDAPRAAIALAAALVLCIFSASWLQPLVIAGGALAALGIRPRSVAKPRPTPEDPAMRPRYSFICLGLFLGLLALLPGLAHLWPSSAWRVVDAFYRTGALVFGGGHVVLPLLQQATVARGWLREDTFLAGYGAAQALPGPLFTFSAFLGASIAPGGVGGGLLALAAIYLPAVLILFAALPHWEYLRHQPRARALLDGANAAVVGLLAAALAGLVWSTATSAPKHLLLAVAAFVALDYARWPSWLIVLACAGAGAAWFG